jgi:Holliday junction resolvase RusA-like endonuclease
MPSIRVVGQPVGKGRARFVRATGRAYTPTNTQNAEGTIQQAWKDAGHPKLFGPLSVDISAFMRRPKDHYGSGRNAAVVVRSAPTWPTARPDIDNLTKTVLDALNGVAWADDSQIVMVNCMKRYVNQLGHHEPGWEIVVESLNGIEPGF